MENPARILVIRLKSIGDVILTLPAVHALRENFPAAKITFLASKESAGLLRGFRDVDIIIAMDRAALRSGNPIKMTREFCALLQRLRAGKFSHVVDFQGYGETAWLARLTGARERWGSVYRDSSKWAYTRGINRDDKLQIADFNLALLAQCGLKTSNVRNEFVLPTDTLDAARTFFAANNLAHEKPTLFLQPFTSSLNKNWPLENYLSLANHFRAAGMQVVFSGGPKEIEALHPAAAAGFTVAAGLPLLEAAGLIQLSTVVVGGVTGLLHLAVAMKKRVVMLVGRPMTEPGLPFQHRDWIVTPAEGFRLSKIKTADVIAACASAFSDQSNGVI